MYVCSPLLAACAAGYLCVSSTNPPANCCICRQCTPGSSGVWGEQGSVSLVIGIVWAHLIIPVPDVSRDCRLQHDWVLAVSNLLLHYIVIGQRWPCSPIPSIFQLKKERNR